MTDLSMKDTIAALATAPGEAGIAIIRISGDQAEAILRAVFRPADQTVTEFEHCKLYYGRVVDQGQEIDECMAVLMKGPRSYTRQDVAELQLHGSPWSVRQTLELLFRYGARPAEPGEFTLRAFLNGRIDLSRAEAVMSLIHASGDRAARQALGQLNGGVSRYIREAQAELLNILAVLETSIDYPEEFDEPSSLAQLAERMEALAERLARSYPEHGAHILTEGINVVLCGKPNAGKSTLLNVLLNEEKAIVTDIPGTTRDLISGSFLLDGYRVNLLDTAGLRDTEDVIEKIGIDRAIEAAERADLVFLLQDQTETSDNAELENLRQRGIQPIILLTKQDLVKQGSGSKEAGISISAITGTGLQKVKEAILASIQRVGEAPLTNDRHIQAAKQAEAALRQAVDALRQGLSEEYAAVFLKEALNQLASVTGEQVDEALLDEIFSSFCVGK